MECGARCRSKLHALELISAVIRGSSQQIKSYVPKCSNYLLAKDDQGRTLLHVASSCGKWEVVQWLIAEGCVVSPQDLESGWTPLHRALFYGQLSCAAVLLQNGASLHTRDHEGLSPLDILMKDRPPFIEFELNGLNDVYMWGDNSNFTLGHGSELRKANPEVLECFRKHRIGLKKVVLQKYHSVFLTNSGRVYSCGHALGGRLGHGNEETYLVPHLVTALQNETVTDISAGRDHSVFLTEGGQVFTCGLNDSHQLGQFPAPDKALVPRQMNAKHLKGVTVQTICSGRFHTVLLIDGAVYTFGLNGGQLGHPRGDAKQSQPRLVSAFNHKDMAVEHITCSSAATVCITTKGEVFVLHEYLCRKVSSRWLDVKQVLVIGGNLEHPVNKGLPLTIAILNSAGKVFLWIADYPVFRRCSWSVKRSLSISSVSLNETGLVVTTKDGEGFVAKFAKLPTGKSKDVTTPSKVISTEKCSEFPSTSLSDLIELDDAVEISVKCLASIHRAVCVSSDQSGFNYAVLQSQPHASITDVPSVSSSEICQHFETLLEEADATDLIHDTILQVGSTEIPAHKFVLSARSSYFKKLFVGDLSQANDSHISIDNVNEQIFMQLLKFIYTDTCELLTIGNSFKLSKSVLRSSHISNGGNIEHCESAELPGSEAAFKVYQNSKQKPGKKRNESKHGDNSGDDPLKMLGALSKRFGVDSLNKKLGTVKFVNGFVQVVKGKSLIPQRMKFVRTMLSPLYDVCLKAEDGTLFQCHKCVLVARLEYFHSMLATGWMETSLNEPLSLPVPPNVLKIVLNFLYSGLASEIVGHEDMELLCNLLVVADQLLIGRLRDMCEVEICSMVTLKTAAELLEFASMYNAHQLKTYCQQFVSHNIAALLENRSLDVLGDDVMEELTKYYRDTTPAMCRRLITPYSCGPSSDYLESLNQGESVSEMPRKPKSKKKRTRTHSSGDGKPAHFESKEIDLSISARDHGKFQPKDIKEEKAEHTHDSGLLNSRANLKSSQNISIVSDDGAGSFHGRSRQRTVSNSSDQFMGVWGSSPPQGSVLSQSPPEGATSIPSMRDIMNQQSKGSKSLKPGRVKMPKLPKKLDFPKSNRDSPSSQDVTGAATVSTVKVSPWGRVDNVVHSLKDVMVSEEKSIVPKSPQSPSIKSSARLSKDAPKTTLSSGAFSWGLPKRDSLKVDVAGAKQDSTAAEKSPWSPTAAPWSPDTVVKKKPAFSEILQSEMSQMEQRKKVNSKPLHLIQIEERAIEELLIHYDVKNSVEERITVQRVKHDIAKPLWKAHSDRNF